MTKISIGVMSCGKESFKPRYEACMDTWAKDFDRVFFFAGEECQDSRLVSLYNVREDYNSAFYKQMYGLGYMYFKCPDSDWYFICGDDNFLYKEHMYEKMSEFDSSQDLFIGGHVGSLRNVTVGGREIWYQSQSEEFWKNKAKEWGVEWDTPAFLEEVKKRRDEYWNGDGVFPSGGAGFFISNSLLKKSLTHIAEFTERWPHVYSRQIKASLGACDVAIAIMMWECLGIKLTRIEGLHGLHPNASKYKSNGWKESIKKPISFHYIPPDEMHRMYENKKKGIYR